MGIDGEISPAAQGAIQECQQRVLSISMVHEQLYATSCFDRINFAEYATQLVGQLHILSALDPSRVRLAVDVSPVELTLDRAVPCGLILCELVTNAFKRAFPHGRSGTVNIQFHEITHDTLRLAVIDHGIGTADETSRSTGMRVVGILANQLAGTFEIHAQAGTTCYEFLFPR